MAFLLTNRVGQDIMVTKLFRKSKVNKVIFIDFGIICIGKFKRSFPKNIEKVRFEVRKRTKTSKPMYDEWYHFQTADRLLGNWYFVWLTEDIFYDESFFDIADDKGEPWIYLEPKWKDTVKRILEFYIEESPIHQIAVLLRIQDRSHDISHPVCSLEEYMNDLEAGNIKWNELYFIKG